MVPLPGRTVLLVEDDFSSLEVLVMLMSGEGLRVVSASDGEEAWAKLLSEPGIGVVVTDYMMPKLNGVELCRKMHADERFRAIPVILMSATYREQLGDVPQLAAVFGKPLLFGTLLAKIKEILGEEGAPTPSA